MTNFFFFFNFFLFCIYISKNSMRWTEKMVSLQQMSNKIFCRSHYIEYLCLLIRQSRLETLSILKADDLETVVRRENRRMPPKPYGILEGIYRRYLAEVRHAQLFIISVFFFFLFNFHHDNAELLILAQLLSTMCHYC